MTDRASYNAFTQQMNRFYTEQFHRNFDQQYNQQRRAQERQYQQALAIYHSTPSEIRRAGNEACDELLGCTPRQQIAYCIAVPVWAFCIFAGTLCLDSSYEAERKVGVGLLSACTAFAAGSVAYLAKRVFCTPLRQANLPEV